MVFQDKWLLFCSIIAFCVWLLMLMLCETPEMEIWESPPEMEIWESPPLIICWLLSICWDKKTTWNIFRLCKSVGLISPIYKTCLQEKNNYSDEGRDGSGGIFSNEEDIFKIKTEEKAGAVGRGRRNSFHGFSELMLCLAAFSWCL